MNGQMPWLAVAGLSDPKHVLAEFYQDVQKSKSALTSILRLWSIIQAQYLPSTLAYNYYVLARLLLLRQEDPLLIPHMISMFANQFVQWSNRELRNRFHDFVVAMAAITLGEYHPITVIITLMRNIHQSNFFALSWERVLNLFGDRLGIGHRATLEGAEAFSSTLHGPSSSRWFRMQWTYLVELRAHWSRKEVFLRLEYIFYQLQDLRSNILDKKREECFWPLPEISESLRLLQAILASNEERTDPRHQGLRHDSGLRFLIVCDQMFDRLAYEIGVDSHPESLAIRFASGSKVVITRPERPQKVSSCLQRTWDEHDQTEEAARRERIQKVFSCLQRTWDEHDQKEEAARLRATYPMPFEEVVTCA